MSIRFLQLTRYQDRVTIWINVAHIAYFIEHKQGATIVFNPSEDGSHTFEVMETPQEIAEQLTAPPAR